MPHSYDEAARQQLRSMPGIRWIRDARSPNGRGYYVGPSEAVEASAAMLTKAGVLKVVDTRDMSPTTVPPAVAIHQSARDYQREGAAWLTAQLQSSGAAMLADEMGLGKTLQAIAAMDATLHPDAPVQVVCPALVRRHWKRQAARWSQQPDRWCIQSYEEFSRDARKDPAHAAAAGGMVLDESHYVMNPKSVRSKAIAGWLGARRSAGPIPTVLLTGTPMGARVRDLWHQLDLMHPGRWGKWFDFTQRYCGGAWQFVEAVDREVWNSDGSSNIDELQQRLRHVMLRRTKQDVDLELPPRTRVCIDVELPARARKALARAAAGTLADGTRGGWGLAVGAVLSHVEGYKLDAAEQLVRDALEQGHRVLVLTTRKESARELASRLSAACVTGDDPADTREDMLRDAACACATMYALECGIDLVGFDVVVFVGLDWVPKVLLQSEARVHRIGQDRAVTIYYLVGEGTLDEVVRERVIERLDVFAAATGSAGDEQGLAVDLGGSEQDVLSAMIDKLRTGAMGT